MISTALICPKTPISHGAAQINLSANIYNVIVVKVKGPDTFGRFFIIFLKGDNFYDFLFAFLHTKPF